MWISVSEFTVQVAPGSVEASGQTIVLYLNRILIHECVERPG